MQCKIPHAKTTKSTRKKDVVTSLHARHAKIPMQCKIPHAMQNSPCKNNEIHQKKDVVTSLHARHAKIPMQ
jgi:hypothetical protein